MVEINNIALQYKYVVGRLTVVGLYLATFCRGLHFATLILCRAFPAMS